jgi:nucleoside-diphosphate-sugar epimerase
MRPQVTGGASFVGSHLVKALLRRGASVQMIEVAAQLETASTER